MVYIRLIAVMAGIAANNAVKYGHLTYRVEADCHADGGNAQTVVMPI